LSIVCRALASLPPDIAQADDNLLDFFSHHAEGNSGIWRKFKKIY
jgi:hypothetical protein